eukprot:GHVS01109148.1.p1 GENE.GHVS01109148.1~~GHVS01109148.1.p1  ORF type:complete len:1321 (-),score=255.94 GHVS01109148.1:219-4181(-)
MRTLLFPYVFLFWLSVEWWCWWEPLLLLRSFASVNTTQLQVSLAPGSSMTHFISLTNSHDEQAVAQILMANFDRPPPPPPRRLENPPVSLLSPPPPPRLGSSATQRTGPPGAMASSSRQLQVDLPTRLLLKVHDNTDRHDELLRVLHAYRNTLAPASAGIRSLPPSLRIRGFSSDVAEAGYLSALALSNSPIDLTLRNEHTKLLKKQIISIFGLDAQRLYVQAAVSLRYLPNVQIAILEMPAVMVGLQSVMESKLEKGVDFVEMDVIVRAHEEPSDPYYRRQWAFSGGGQTKDIRIEEAWNKIADDHTSGIVVAVVDTGVDYKHPELVNQMWVNEKEFYGEPGVDDDGNGFVDDIHGYDFSANDADPMDEDGHGSHCAGLVAAQANNGQGIAGVFQGAKIMALRFLQNSNLGFISDAIRSLEYAIANGARVLSNSWGGTSQRTRSLEAILYLCNTNNILFVAAAGNFHSDNDEFPDYPSSYSHSNLLSVAATARDGSLASFSNYGKNSVDIGAPGEDMLSLSVRTDTRGMYKVRKGTSMACPLAAGVASLVWSSVGKEARNYEIKHAIIKSSKSLSNLEGKMVGGLLDAAAAVEEVEQMMAAKRWVSFDTSVSASPLEPSETIVLAITLTALEEGVTTHRSVLRISLESRGTQQVKTFDIPTTIQVVAAAPPDEASHGGMVSVKTTPREFRAIRGAYSRPRSIGARYLSAQVARGFRLRHLAAFVEVAGIEGEGAESFYTFPEKGGGVVEVGKKNIKVGCLPPLLDSRGEYSGVLMLRVMFADSAGMQTYVGTERIPLTCKVVPVSVSPTLVQMSSYATDQYITLAAASSALSSHFDYELTFHAMSPAPVSATSLSSLPAMGETDGAMSAMYTMKRQSTSQDWVEIGPGGRGTQLKALNGRDDGTVRISLTGGGGRGGGGGGANGSIYFARASWDVLYVSMNGFVSVVPFESISAYPKMRSTRPPNGVIAVYWRDLSLLRSKPSSGVYYLKEGGRVIVQWQDMQIHGTAYSVTFQMIIYQDGTIRCTYKDVIKGSPPKQGNRQYGQAMVGLEHPSGRSAVYFHSSYRFPLSGMSVVFTPLPPPLTVESFLTASRSSAFLSVRGAGASWLVLGDVVDGPAKGQLSRSNNRRQIPWKLDEEVMVNDGKHMQGYIVIKVRAHGSSGGGGGDSSFQAEGIIPVDISVRTPIQRPMSGDASTTTTSTTTTTTTTTSSPKNDQVTFRIETSRRERWHHGDEAGKYLVSAFRRISGYALAGFNSRGVLVGGTVVQCAERCLRQQQCKSFDYDIVRSECFMSAESRSTQIRHFGPVASTYVDYFEKIL